MRKLALAVLVLAAVACNDQPTRPNDQTPALSAAPISRTLAASAAQGDRSEWTYQWTFPAVPKDQPWPSGVWSCINGGHGEDVLYWGPEALFWAKAVVTPSGNTHYQGYYSVGGDGIDHYIGVTSGDEWVSAPFAWYGKTVETSFANGAWKLHESASEDFTNLRTGERARVLFQWVFHVGKSGSDVGNIKNGEAISCHIQKH